MRRADRLFQLVQLLRARRFATGQQLAEELGVSKRTVYRDIRDLEASGVPIRGEAGVGYQLEKGYDLPPLTFNGAEIEALVLGARIVTAWGDEELASAASTAMTKVEAVLPQTLRDVLVQTPLFAPNWGRRREMVDHLPLIRQAIGDRRLLRFSYRRADGEDSQRTVRPLGLYFWGTKWTLASWCEFRVDYRSFRPDRMADLLLLDERFDGDGDISLRGFLEAMGEDDDRGGPRPAR